MSVRAKTAPQDFGSVFFLFFPMVREFHGAPVGNVTTFSFTEYAIEHSGGAEQSDMATMWARSGEGWMLSWVWVRAGAWSEG